MKRTQYLFCPGPVHVAQSVKKASEVDICHREAEFSVLLESLSKNILDLFEIKNPAKYHPVVITGSSTAANESVLSSVMNDLPTLVVSNGEFGDRLFKIASIYNKKTYLLNFGWVQRFDLEEIEKYVKKYKIKLIAVVHHETSTGMINPIEKVGKLAQKYNSLFFVDAVSSGGAMPIAIEDSKITFCTTASGKAIGSFPGTSIVLGKVEEFEKLKEYKQRTTYLHLYNFYHYSKHLLQTPNTPNVAGFLALNKAISNILKEGVKARREKITRYALLLRKTIKEVGLECLLDSKDMSNVLTTVKVPAGMTATEIQDKLRKKGIIIYGGKGILKEKYFQIANIGDITMSDLKYFIQEFKNIFKKAKKTAVFGQEQFDYPAFEGNVQ